jgi:hypothetical protein
MTVAWQTVVIKDGEYQLRLDPPDEGGEFSFFVDLDGWEPRVSSALAPELGVWYSVAAGWTADEVWLEVDGERTRKPRTGTPRTRYAPLEIGEMNGAIRDLRLRNPNALDPAVAHWDFNDGLADRSGNGHDLHAGEGQGGLMLVPGRDGGSALAPGTREFTADSAPDLELAAGFRIDCVVRLDAVPDGIRHILIKDGEYQLRVNPAVEGGDLAFFVNLDGRWEPRVRTSQPLRPGAWHRVSVSWTGTDLALTVDGKRFQNPRMGMPRPTANPVRVGSDGVVVDDLRVENPRRPVLRVLDLRQDQGVLRAGRDERLRVRVGNLGAPAEATLVRLELPDGVRCLGSDLREVGSLSTGGEEELEWTVLAESAVSGLAVVVLEAESCPVTRVPQSLAFLPEREGPGLAPQPRRSGAAGSVTYYVDSRSGSNTAAGTSPDAAWQDFTNVNGKVLGPGDRLLIRRGSVINQELVVTARGTEDNWAEIGAYGEGARPVIRRNWDIDDRCVLVREPDYLRISSLLVCYAGKGLVVTYVHGGHRGLVIEDCIAHHIEGLYRPNAHGIPEWRDRGGAPGDGLRSSAGFVIMGQPARDLVLRDCEMFQCSWGFFVAGEAVTVDRVYCHDNHAHNTSPHPALVSVRRSYLQNSVFDASGWHASAGTMGIMLVNPQGLVIRNCTFRNQPDSGSHDEGGIDFENTGSGCLIEACTFENNAGAAIEMLGLRSPQTRNVEIRGSQFIRNNVANKLGPAEIYVWGQSPDPAVCCSTGWIRGNAYVTNPGVGFYVNEAPELTSWELSGNTGFETVAELQAYLPLNRPPVVDAGPDLHTDVPTVQLRGRVADDSRPVEPGQLRVRWEVLEGPGSVVFEDPGAEETVAEFEMPGDYLLRLVADDGELWLSDILAVHVLEPGLTTVAAWEFNGVLDKDGWTEVGLGTSVQEWSHPQWPTVSHPVRHVAGGFYSLAIEESADAHLLSPDDLGIPLTGDEILVLRLRHHTSAERMRVQFVTDTDQAWGNGKAREFAVVPKDTVPRVYQIPMAGVPGWSGHLRRVRVDIGTGIPLTGSCRLDYIWVLRGK